jgi:hypothetical protein
MGNVKDRYFKYADNGDQYVGRCLSLLPILSVDLAVSPPYFAASSDSEIVKEMVSVQFHSLSRVPEYGLLLRMCLASLLYHSRWIAEFLSSNHVVKTSSVCFRNRENMERIKKEKWVVVSYPWSAPKLVFSGIPPFCSLLQHIAEVRSEQKGKKMLTTNFYFNKILLSTLLLILLAISLVKVFICRLLKK